MINYSRRDVVIGFIIIILIVAGAFYYKKVKTAKVTSSPSPISFEFQKDFEDKFKFDLPDDANSIELKDVSGGDGRGIATEKEILVDVKDPDTGYFYEAWLQNSSSEEPVSLGKLQMAKGGWLLEYNGSLNSGPRKIIISLEKKFDSKLEQKILEGTFN